MDFLDILSTNAYNLILSALLGAFLGLRREIQEKDNNGFMGLRTMALISMLGGISALFTDLPYVPVIVFSGFLLLIVVAYALGFYLFKKVGLTAEISALITFWIGVFSVKAGMLHFAVLITVLLAFFDAAKKEVQDFSATLSTAEWRGALELLIFSAIILPVLPQTAIDPWGVLVPYNVWFLILLISGISFLGYFFTKHLGDKIGILLTAFLGGMSSSTAVTVALAEKSKDERKLEDLRIGVLVAIATMQVRALIIIATLSAAVIGNNFFLAPSLMILAELIFIAYYWYGKDRKQVKVLSDQKELKLESPFSILPALKFGLIFVVILFVVHFAKVLFGTSGVYLAALISSLVDVDAIVLSALEALRQNTMQISVFTDIAMIAIIVNSLVKLAYVQIIGTKKLTLKLLPSLLVSGLVGVVAYLIII